MKQILSQNYAMIGDDLIIGHPTTIFTDDDVPVYVFATEQELNYHISQQDPINFPPLPEIGQWCERNQCYQYGDLIAKCVQAHNRMHYSPEQTPALFLIITPTGNDYPVWVQPTGAHDSYQIEDIVHYPNIDSPLWICVAGDGSGNNSWAPGVYGWELYIP